MGTTQFRGYPRVDPGAAPDLKSIANDLADAVDADVEKLATGIREIATLYYAASATFTKGQYPDLRKVMVECYGAGGGSGFAPSTDASHVGAGAAGGGGAYTLTEVSAGDLLSSETVTVGVGGVAGDSGTPTGGDGGDTTFGAHVTAGGGTGGLSASDVFAGSTVSVLRGQAGTPSGTYFIGLPGEGGGAVTSMDSTYLGTAAGPLDITGLVGGSAAGPYGSRIVPPNVAADTASSVVIPPTAGLFPGGGASGGYNNPSAASQDGTAGADGLVIIHVYV